MWTAPGARLLLLQTLLMLVMRRRPVVVLMWWRGIVLRALFGLMTCGRAPRLVVCNSCRSWWCGCEAVCVVMRVELRAVDDLGRCGLKFLGYSRDITGRGSGAVCNMSLMGARQSTSNFI